MAKKRRAPRTDDALGPRQRKRTIESDEDVVEGVEDDDEVRLLRDQLVEGC